MCWICCFLEVYHSLYSRVTDVACVIALRSLPSLFCDAQFVVKIHAQVGLILFFSAVWPVCDVTS